MSSGLYVFTLIVAEFISTGPGPLSNWNELKFKQENFLSEKFCQTVGIEKIKEFPERKTEKFYTRPYYRCDKIPNPDAKCQTLLTSGGLTLSVIQGQSCKRCAEIDRQIYIADGGKEDRKSKAVCIPFG